ncbi:MAG: hypothetical protein DWI26_04425 [Planctomycetota bacterium]|nr:MAG: hypothetical protein DWI26_04425 [Planctomycetota bacterium]
MVLLTGFYGTYFGIPGAIVSCELQYLSFSARAAFIETMVLQGLLRRCWTKAPLCSLRSRATLKPAAIEFWSL